MTANNRYCAESADLLAEMRQIHREVAELHREMSQALGGLATLVRALDAINIHDQSQPGVTALQARQNCPSCGAKVEHHGAEAGDLIICRNCGWSEFVDANGAESDVHADMAPAACVPPREA